MSLQENPEWRRKATPQQSLLEQRDLAAEVSGHVNTKCFNRQPEDFIEDLRSQTLRDMIRSFTSRNEPLSQKQITSLLHSKHPTSKRCSAQADCPRDIQPSQRGTVSGRQWSVSIVVTLIPQKPSPDWISILHCRMCTVVQFRA